MRRGFLDQGPTGLAGGTNGGNGGGSPAASALSQGPLDALCEVIGRSDNHVRLNPPAMDAVYDNEYEAELLAAVQRALELGADAAAVYRLVDEVGAGLLCRQAALFQAPYGPVSIVAPSALPLGTLRLSVSKRRHSGVVRLRSCAATM